MQLTRPLAVLIVLVGLAGCNDSLVRDERNVAEGRAQAVGLADSGRHKAAAEQYERLAASSGEQLGDELWLQAAVQWYRADNMRRALRALERRTTTLTPGTDPAAGLLAAALAFDRGQREQSLELIAGIPQPYPATDAAAILGLEARVRFAEDDPAGAVAALVRREVWLETDAAVADNHKRIWEGLSRAGVRGSALLPPADANDTVLGWLALGRLSRWADSDPYELKSGLLEWQASYPDHPAGAQVVPSLLARYRSLTKFPQQVALLLPLSGRLSASADAVRDGFMAAHFDQSAKGDGPRIGIFDTASGDLNAAYEQAVRSGADFVVGPLTKSAVQQMAALPRRVPHLALNYRPEPERVPGSFFQFGLAPEDEARQVARRMLAEGNESSLALVANNDWGRRLLEAFQQTLEDGGGQLLDYGFFTPGASDFSLDIKRLLRLDLSERRHRDLVTTLGMRLAFEPRRRRDADGLFLAAQAPQARLIRPQLRFHHASNLPTYATSSIYTPGIARRRNPNIDLDGLVFADIPWLIEPTPEGEALWSTLAGFWPRRLERHARLFAMGYDAYRLVPLLYGQGSLGESAFPGLTGRLSFDRSGRIHRELKFARLRNGTPRPLDPPLESLFEAGAEPTITSSLD